VPDIIGHGKTGKLRFPGSDPGPGLFLKPGVIPVLSAGIETSSGSKSGSAAGL
jgi:hypothetical protein